MEVVIDDRQKIPLNKNLIKELSLYLLREMKALEESELSISLVDRDEMRKLNKRWRRIDKVTDVLSFSYGEAAMLGDIVICPEEIRESAKREEENFNRRFAMIVVHGTLHLLRYNHKSEKEAEAMSSKEEQLLGKFGPSKLKFE